MEINNKADKVLVYCRAKKVGTIMGHLEVSRLGREKEGARTEVFWLWIGLGQHVVARVEDGTKTIWSENYERGKEAKSRFITECNGIIEDL